MIYLKKVKLFPLNPDMKEELKDGPGNFEPEGGPVNVFVENRQ